MIGYNLLLNINQIYSNLTKQLLLKENSSRQGRNHCGHSADNSSSHRYFICDGSL